jgi:amphi-Trp domain-containing protein
MNPIEHTTKERLRREDAAARLRSIADELARHNELPFVRDGLRYTLRVPDEVDFSLEIEVGEDECEIEVELMWSSK